jgi:protein-tyrosine phosphatase
MLCHAKSSQTTDQSVRRRTMAAGAYWIEGTWRGRLAIVPRPRGGDWLEDEVADWRESGINVVVSFLTPDEVAELGLEAEKEAGEARGVRFVSFPIPDRGVPKSRVAAAELLRDLEQSLAKGESIALHCRQSIGRSALIAASLLVAAGEDPASSFERISAARGYKVPETAEQERWVGGFAPELAKHPAL